MHILVHLHPTLNNDHGEHMGHTIYGASSALNTSGNILWVQNIYQPVAFNIRGSWAIL